MEIFPFHLADRQDRAESCMWSHCRYLGYALKVSLLEISVNILAIGTSDVTRNEKTHAVKYNHFFRKKMELTIIRTPRRWQLQP